MGSMAFGSVGYCWAACAAACGASGPAAEHYRAGVTLMLATWPGAERIRLVEPFAGGVVRIGGSSAATSPALQSARHLAAKQLADRHLAGTSVVYATGAIGDINVLNNGACFRV